MTESLMFLGTLRDLIEDAVSLHYFISINVECMGIWCYLTLLEGSIFSIYLALCLVVVFFLIKVLCPKRHVKAHSPRWQHVWWGQNRVRQKEESIWSSWEVDPDMMCERMGKIDSMKTPWHTFQKDREGVLESGNGRALEFERLWLLPKLNVYLVWWWNPQFCDLFTEWIWTREFPSMNYDFIILKFRILIF